MRCGTGMPLEDMEPGDREAVQAFIKLLEESKQVGHIQDMNEILNAYAGLDVDSSHGDQTGRRFLDMLAELTACEPNKMSIAGRMKHMEECVKWKTFPSDQDEMVVELGIPFQSLCNHHLAPFMGVAHVAYIPDGKIAGLSKIPRAVQHFSRRLQVQEELTGQIADWLSTHLSPDVGIVMKAEHLCMALRGVRVPGVKTVTSKMMGKFGDHSRTAKAEFLAMVNG
jgi:GTP cyclohydrolase IA